MKAGTFICFENSYIKNVTLVMLAFVHVFSKQKQEEKIQIVDNFKNYWSINAPVTMLPAQTLNDCTDALI